MKVKELREELITGIRDILTTLGVTEFRWADLDLGWTPILDDDELDGNNAYSADFIKIDGVSGSNCWNDGFWYWDDISTELIEEIYNAMSNYENEE